jgi:hypothetical protein
MSDEVKVDKMISDREAELDRQLRKTLTQINNQMEEIRQEAVRTSTPPVTMKDSKGDYIWAPLVVAKAQILRSLFLISPGEEV